MISRAAGSLDVPNRRTMALCCIGLAVAVPSQAQISPGTAFVDVAVVPMDRERVLHHQTVVVSGDRIVALGPKHRIRVPEEAQRIDGRGMYLVPGLADMHVHGVAVSRSELWRYLANGVTTVRDMHAGQGPTSAALEAQRAVASGTLLGPRIYTAGDLAFQSPQRPDSSAIRNAGTWTAALKRDGYDFIKLYAWPRPVYDSVVAAAHRVGLRIVGHVPTSGGSGRDFGKVGLERVLRDRWASIEHATGYFSYLTGGFPEESPAYIGLEPEIVTALDTARWLTADYQWDTAKIRAIAVATRKAGVWNCPTLSSQETYGAELVASLAYAPKRQQWLIQWLGLIIRMVKALQDAGAGLLLGTDVRDPAAVHEELRLMVMKAGLTPYQALATGTRNVALFLGTQDSAGTVAVGKRADLVLLDGNPLQDIHMTASPIGVMIGGQWLSRMQLEAGPRAIP